MIAFSPRLSRIKLSPSTMAAQKVRDLRAAGRDIIGLTIGEPDFNTPEHVKRGVIAALQRNETRYPPINGIPQLREAVRRKFIRDNGLDYPIDQIMVGTGSKQILFNALQATVSAGDEVIIPAPYWISYLDMTLVADGTPVVVDCGMEHGFKIMPQQLDAAITPRTKWLMLNSPGNPSGAVYSRAELLALAEVLRRHPQVWILSDDIYEHLRFDGVEFCTMAQIAPDLAERTLTVNGVSKAYAMTGWRIGYCGGPVEIVTAMSTIQSQSTSNPVSMSQKAAIAALNGDQSCVTEMNKHFKARHDFFNAGLNALPGFKVLPGAGTFYAFCDINDAMHKLGMMDDHVFAEFLLEKAGVAGVPGSGFGAPGHIRFSFAVSMQTLENALERMRKALATG